MTPRQALILSAVFALFAGARRGAAQDPGADLERMVREYFQYPDDSASALVADEAAGPEPGRAQYDCQSVGEVVFQIGTVEGLQVGVALHKKRSLEVGVFVVNQLRRSAAFRPSEIKVEAERRGRRIPLRTFSAEEWEERMGLEPASEAGAQRASIAGPPTTSSAGGGRRTIFYEPPCTEVGTATPGDVDCSGGWQRPVISDDKAGSRRSTTSEVAVSNLARAHTIASGRFYGGIVHIQKKKADRYRVTVPFGGETFSFAFRIE